MNCFLTNGLFMKKMDFKVEKNEILALANYCEIFIYRY